MPSFSFLLGTEGLKCRSNFLKARNKNSRRPQWGNRVLRVARGALTNPNPEIHRRCRATCGETDLSAQPGAWLLHRPARTGHALGAEARAQPANRPAVPGKRGPPSQAAPRVFGPPRSAPRRREASAARPQMSLPLRLPYCYPARQRRGALWLACICAAVTPPPSPARFPGLGREYEGGAADGCSEAAAAWDQARSGRECAH